METSDLATNAYLYARGHRPVSHRVDGRRVMLVWPHTDVVELDLDKFHAGPGGMVVNAFELAAAYRDVKATISGLLARQE